MPTPIEIKNAFKQVFASILSKCQSELDASSALLGTNAELITNPNTYQYYVRQINEKNKLFNLLNNGLGLFSTPCHERRESELKFFTTKDLNNVWIVKLNGDYNLELHLVKRIFNIIRLVKGIKEIQYEFLERDFENNSEPAVDFDNFKNKILAILEVYSQQENALEVQKSTLKVSVDMLELEKIQAMYTPPKTEPCPSTESVSLNRSHS